MSYPQTHQGKLGIGLVTGAFYPHSFDLVALDEFEDFVQQHEGCLWYSDVSQELAEGDVQVNKIAIRHDVDHSIVHALRFASWEADHGINASYYILPTAPYYAQEDTVNIALEIQAMGHEIGVHNDAVTHTARALSKPVEESVLMNYAVAQLGDWTAEMRSKGINITGCADHGGGEPRNVDLWNWYAPQDVTLAYECYALHAQGANYISDNRGQWRAPLVKIEDKQTHVLMHPEHWRLP